jgi:flagellar basal-body rod modification protein FlgD
MTTATTTQSTTSTTGSSSPAVLENKSSILGKDDFLKLLVTQLKYQDPLKPTDQGQFMSQMAQFSTVEGINNLQSTLREMSQSTAVSQAVGLIGKEVTYLGANGLSTTGLAGSIALLDGALTVRVGDKDVAMTDVLSVAAAGAAGV